MKRTDLTAALIAAFDLDSPPVFIGSAKSAQAFSIAYELASTKMPAAVVITDGKTGWPSTADALANVEKLGRHKRCKVIVVSRSASGVLPRWADSYVTSAPGGEE